MDSLKSHSLMNLKNAYSLNYSQLQRPTFSTVKKVFGNVWETLITWSVWTGLAVTCDHLNKACPNGAPQGKERLHQNRRTNHANLPLLSTLGVLAPLKQPSAS